MSHAKLKEITGGRNHSEKTSLNGLFVLFSSLASNNVISAELYVILVVVEAFHFLYVPIQFAEGTDQSFNYFSDVTSVVNYFKFLVTKEQGLGVIILFCAHAVFITMIVAAAAVVVYYGKKANVKRMKLISMLSVFMSSSMVLITTVLIIPMLESFIFPMLCSNGKHQYFEVSFLVCGSASQIALSIVGGIYAFLTVVVFYTFNRLLLDDYWLSTLPWAGECQDVQFIHGVVKILLGVYLGVDLEGKYSTYAMVVFFLLQLSVVWHRVDVTTPYKKLVYTTKLLQESIVLCTYAHMLMVRLYDNNITLWNEAVVMIIGLCVGIVAAARADAKRKELMEKDWNQLRSVTDVENYIQIACSLCFGGQGTANWKFFCNYVHHIHVQSCTDPECVCQAIQRLTSPAVKGAAAASGENKSQAPVAAPAALGSGDDAAAEKDIDELWVKLLELVIESQAVRWGVSRRIMLQLSYFECLMIKNYFKSYYWLLKADELRSADTDQFLIFRMKRILAGFIIMKESKNAGAAHVNSVMRFQKACNSFQSVLLYCTNIIVSFWTLLEMPNLNAAELYSKGQSITCALRWVNDIFKKSIEINPDYSYNYFYYGNFLKHVLNSEDEGREWLEKGEDIMKEQRDSWAKYSGDIGKSSDTAVLVISGNLKTLGLVESANEHVRQQLGFEVSDLLGRNVSRIMPRIIGEVHDDFLLRHFKLGYGSLIGNERLVFAQTKDGLMEPICLLINTLPGLERGLQYIGFMRRDLAKIRNQFVKLPSQYKGHKLSYIVANKERYMIGLSKNACGLFGLTTKYIIRKKGLTTAPYSMSKLAPELGSEENEHKLEIGMELTMNVRSILEFLDYDYLKHEEERDVIKCSQDPRRVFVMLLNFNYHDMVKLKAYVIVDLDKHGDDAGDKYRHQFGHDDRGALIDAFHTDHAQERARSDKIEFDTASSPSRAGSSSAKNSQSSVSTIKKQANIRDMPAPVRRLMWVILIFTGIIVASVATEYALAYVALKKVFTLHDIVIYAYKRITHFNISVYRMLAYMNIANGLELENCTNIPNRTIALLPDTDQYLNYFKGDEYSFEELTMDSVAASLRPQVVSLPITVRLIQENFGEYNSTEALNSVIMSIVAKGVALMHRTKVEITSKNFVNNFVQSSSSDTLTDIERDMYFILANSLYRSHYAMSDSGLKIYAKCKDEIDTQRLILIMLHCAIYAVCVVYGLMFIPIILRIQSGKRNLLMLFAEIPLGTIHTLNDSCRNFLRKNLQHLSRRGTVESTESLRILSMNQAAIRAKKNSRQGVADKDEKDEKDDKEKAKDNDDMDTEQVKEKLRPKPKASTPGLDAQQKGEEDKLEATEEKDETQEQLLAKAKQEKELDFAKDRKKAVQKVPVTIGYAALIVLLVFLSVMGYFAKMLILITSALNDSESNLSSVIVLYRRWSTLSSAFLYYRSFLKSLTKYHYAIGGQDPFDYYFAESLKCEADAERFKVYTPSDLTSLSTMMKTYDSSELCATLESQVGLNYTWCGLLDNGLLKEGLTKSISYFLTRTRDKYVNITLSVDPATEKLREMQNVEFTNLIFAFLRVYNPLFDYFSNEILSAFNGFIDNRLLLLTVDFAVVIALTLISLLILVKYFLARMEEEIFISRGIITLLPESVLASPSAVKMIRDEHQLSQ
ncbi:MAG: hypothetical protein P4M11_13780 [Candidatus Pacebacteria bacterium]|nr:hypothetical protein [Candidatus Paceibacterota bacterium]